LGFVFWDLGFFNFMSELNDLYQSVILDHNKRPRNRRKLPAATRVVTGENPDCGDNCTVYLRLDSATGRAAEITFEGAGCAISQASASLMTTLLKGKTAAGAAAVFDEFSTIVKTGRAPGEFCEMAAFAGVHAFPARIKCATLAWHAALDALREEKKAEKPKD
jgi:nitrogen fixation NifU-like protein